MLRSDVVSLRNGVIGAVFVDPRLCANRLTTAVAQLRMMWAVSIDLGDNPFGTILFGFGLHPFGTLDFVAKSDVHGVLSFALWLVLAGFFSVCARSCTSWLATFAAMPLLARVADVHVWNDVLGIPCISVGLCAPWLFLSSENPRVRR